MYKVDKIEIDGFWGNFSLQSYLDKDVNIFIGDNGSGKTTFVNFLEASLTVDIELLESLQFDEIRLWLKDKARSKKITITRNENSYSFNALNFKIGKHPYIIPIVPKRADIRREYPTRFQSKQLESVNTIRKILSELVNVSWLSVHREILEDEYRDPITRRSEPEINPVDRRIRYL